MHRREKEVYPKNAGARSRRLPPSDSPGRVPRQDMQYQGYMLGYQ